MNNAEPFALDLGKKPLCVSVRAKVILSFVAFALGKGGLFISSFLLAMSWLDIAYLPYGVVLTGITLIVMALGYIATFGRVEAQFDTAANTVKLTRRYPLFRQHDTLPLSDYRGIVFDVTEDGMHTLTLSHAHTDHFDIPLHHCRHAEAPMSEAISLGKALGVGVMRPVTLSMG
ncbi:MAG: hypothetical protein OQK24_06210 [Magnetovibrio sp.]|nr:hypothetical protein [Magnetovibrio sp.]